MEKEVLSKEFLTAWVRVQKTLKPAIKDATNPHFKSKYADLASCYEACRDVLSDNGFDVFQIPHIENNLCLLSTKIIHVSGQEITGVMPICTIDTPPQQKGSALTYTRRQLLTCMVGIAPEDDDANAATHGHQAPKAPMAQPKPQSPKLAGDFIVPFGKSQGMKVKDVARDVLEKTLDWCIEKEKAPEFQEAILAHLDSLTEEPLGDLPPFDQFK